MSALRKIFNILKSELIGKSFCIKKRQASVKRPVYSADFSPSKFGRKMSSPFSSEGFIDIGDYSVFARSVSGLETTVVVRRICDKFTVCFDMGVACRQNLNCDRIFISHGHMDHISAVPQHVAKRNLYGMKMAKYYTPPHLTESLKNICEMFHKVNETSDALDKVDLMGVKPGDSIELGKGHFVIPFKTFHRVQSQGYILYRRTKKLKAEYRELPGQEIGELIKNSVDVHDIDITPEVAYTGDTTFELFQNQECSPPTDLFKVKLLIVEATYIDFEDRKDMIQQARDRGHIHLFEIFQNAELFQNIDKVMLIHFSDKYSVKYVQEQVYSNIPESLKDKVITSAQNKSRT